MESIQQAFAEALRLFEAGDVAEAEQICRQILTVDENSVSTWNFLGVIALKQRRYAEAEEYTRNAIALAPQWADAHNSLGLVLYDQGQLKEAAAHYRQAVQLNPNFALAHYNLGLTFYDRGLPEEAIEHCRRAVAIQPDFVPARLNLGNALKVIGRLNEAAVEYEAALAIKPEFVEAVHNLASLRWAEGKYGEALKYYEQAVALAPAFSVAHKNLSQLRLLLEDFERGWPEFEWRWKTGEMPEPAFPEPRWTGESLNGQTILLYAEQGFGDTFQFIRYASLVRARGGRVVMHCPRSLVPLLSRCAGVDQWISGDDELPRFTCQAPLLSLPNILQTTIESIPAEVPYVFADDAKVEQWKIRLAPNRGF